MEQRILLKKIFIRVSGEAKLGEKGDGGATLYSSGGFGRVALKRKKEDCNAIPCVETERPSVAVTIGLLAKDLKTCRRTLGLCLCPDNRALSGTRVEQHRARQRQDSNYMSRPSLATVPVL